MLMCKYSKEKNQNLFTDKVVEQKHQVYAFVSKYFEINTINQIR